MQNTETNASAPVEDRVVRGREAEAMTGLVDMQRRRLEERNLFPKRFKLNPAGGPRGSYGYSHREIMDWIEERLASRNTAA